MTKFDKEMFTWDGMYLMYKGDFDGAQMMMDVCPDAHPSWEGKLKPTHLLLGSSIVNLTRLGLSFYVNTLLLKSI